MLFLSSLDSKKLCVCGKRAEETGLFVVFFFLLTLNSLGKEQRERVREGKELGRWMEGRTERRKKGADGGRDEKQGRQRTVESCAGEVWRGCCVK